MRLRDLVAFRSKRRQYYRGRLVHADLGVHEQVARELVTLIPRGAPVLDLGAGAGALAERLADLGYTVTGVDVDRSEWQSPAITFVEAPVGPDLAARLGGAPTFDAIVCVEVVEHLDSSAELFRQAQQLLPVGGHLVVTTPNVSSFLSRLVFLFNGHLHQFGPDDLAYGHVNPIFAHILERLAADNGFALRAVRPAGRLPLIDLSTRRPKFLLLNLPRVLLYPLMRGHRDGWCLLYRFERVNTEPQG